MRRFGVEMRDASVRSLFRRTISVRRESRALADGPRAPVLVSPNGTTPIPVFRENWE